MNKLVSTYQDWCRELFPKIPYENLIEKVYFTNMFYRFLNLVLIRVYKT